MLECRNCCNEVDFICVQGDSVLCPSCGIETTENDIKKYNGIEPEAVDTDEGMLFNVIPKS